MNVDSVSDKRILVLSYKNFKCVFLNFGKA